MEWATLGSAAIGEGDEAGESIHGGHQLVGQIAEVEADRIGDSQPPGSLDQGPGIYIRARVADDQELGAMGPLRRGKSIQEVTHAFARPQVPEEQHHFVLALEPKAPFEVGIGVGEELEQLSVAMGDDQQPGPGDPGMEDGVPVTHAGSEEETEVDRSRPGACQYPLQTSGQRIDCVPGLELMGHLDEGDPGSLQPRQHHPPAGQGKGPHQHDVRSS